MTDRSRFRPEVVIYVDADGETLLDWVQAGLEEQSVPWRSATGRGSAAEMAYLAAQDSLLKVGIGISVGDVVLHQSEMSRENPLFSGRPNSPTEARVFGENAGRLVKGLPLSDFNPSAPETEDMEVVRIVSRAVTRALAEYRRWGR